jgi:histidine decarboxylase
LKIISSTKNISKEVELDVLKFFSKLWNIDFDNSWSYITHAGTEGNLQGLFIARESANKNPHVFYASRDSHYSIFKIARILQLNVVVVNSQENGEMDYKDFDLKLSQNKDKYTIVCANLGTTMKGAIDNTKEIYRIIGKYNLQNYYYIHADGALSGFYLPFLEKDLFFKAKINSMSISGHKFTGVPFPCGIFIMEKKFLNLIENNVEYIWAKDCTISGSRNGHSSIFLKHIIDKKGYDGFKEDVDKCIELAEYAASKIPNAWRNHNSITVIFPKPSFDIIEKWQLASQDNISHIVVVPHITKERIDLFVEDLIKK